MRGPEGKLQDTCLRFMRKRGWEVNKIVIGSRPGWPDTYGIKNGKHLWIEFKRPGEVPEPLQEAIQAKMREQGAIVWNVDNVAKFKEMLILHAG